MTAVAERRSRGADIALLATVGCMFMAQTFPSAFAGSLLPSIFRKQGLDLKQFWIFALPQIPYWVRFLAAPVIDRHWLPWLGRRRSWFLPCTLLACLLYGSLALFEPVQSVLVALVAILFVKSIVTATQEIAIDAYAVDAVDERLRGPAASFIVVSEAVGQMLALILLGQIIQHFGWKVGALIASLLMLLFLLPAFIRAEPATPPAVLARIERERRERTPLFRPLARFFRRPEARYLVPMFVLVGLFSGAVYPMLGPFLVDLGFDLGKVGAISGLVLGGSTLVGAIGAPTIVRRLGVPRAMGLLLLLLPIAAAPAVWAAATRPTLGMGGAIAALFPLTLIVVIFYVAWYALRLAFASKLQAGTDFSTAAAITRIGQTVAGAAGGPVAAALGWPAFWTAVALIGATAMVALRLLHGPLMALVEERNRMELA